MKAIRIHATGGPDVLQLEEIDQPVPRAGQVVIKVAAAGVNFADLMQRQGTYLRPTRTPATLGVEVAGTVEEVGPDVKAVKEGQRVAAFTVGGYAEYALASVDLVLPIPPSLDFARAAAFPVQGVTAYQLLHDCAALQPGESVLVHAAAGGVGTLAVQIARFMGAGTILGTASSETKRNLVRQLGAHCAIDYTRDGWEGEVREATGGRGADVILEMVGGRVGEGSLTCLAPFGRMIVFGRAGGESFSIDPVRLMTKNQAVVGYWLTGWMERRERVAAAVSALMRYLEEGHLEIIVGETFPLRDAAAAHRAMAERKTTGKVVLVCD